MLSHCHVQARHEVTCGRFDAPSDSDEESIPEYWGRTYFSDEEDEFDNYEDNFGAEFERKGSKDWRSTHEDVLNKIRRDRLAYQSKLNRRASGLSPPLCCVSVCAVCLSVSVWLAVCLFVWMSISARLSLFLCLWLSLWWCFLIYF